MPERNMSKAKFGAIACGARRMTGDELIAFCRATETNPNYFFDVVTEQDSA